MANAPDFNDDDQLRNEVASLFQCIRRLKAEIAQLIRAWTNRTAFSR